MTWTPDAIRELRQSLAPTTRERRARKLRSHPARLELGITQGEFADRLGTTARTVSRWESGASRVRSRLTLDKLARMRKQV